MSRIGRTSMALAALVVALATAGAAHAAQLSELSPKAALALEDRLGGKSAGTYLDSTRDAMVVTVTDAESAEEVRQAGGTARIVDHSGAELERIMALLERAAGGGGTAWGVNPVKNEVVLTVDATVTAAELARLETIVEPFGDAVRVERTSGALRPFAGRPIGGDWIVGGDGGRCSVGFNVTKDGAPHLLTAGHCGNIPTWSTLGDATATTVAVNYPGDDFALVRYDDGSRRSGYVNLYNGYMRDIRRAGDAYVGQAVQTSGSTSEFGSGTVSGVNETVDYGNGNIIYGMVRTDVCSDFGDSGGPLFAGTTALGILSGGIGNCATDGETFFQPVTEALDTYGAAVY